MALNEERKKNKINKNDSFFSLEPLIERIIDNEGDNEDIVYETILRKNFIFETNLEEKIIKFINFKINFISDINKLIELIKLHYLSGQEINSAYMQSFFDYYILILKNDKEAWEQVQQVFKTTKRKMHPAIKVLIVMAAIWIPLIILGIYIVGVTKLIL